ncbi:MAG: response regulator transcription factor [Lachnospiraceae bacterium]|nr:response regulator transcription factor [Lachnospiraceae bacterium]
MYRVALCDDMDSELEQIEDFLHAYGRRNPMLRYGIKRFDNAQRLIDWVREEREIPDLLLMDIFMPGKNGLEAVRELRRDGYEMPVVFLTTSTEYALKAYEVDAISYLVKPLQPQALFHAMDRVLGISGKERKESLLVKISGGSRQIDPEQIIYCEAQKNYQILYLEGEEVRVRMTGGKLYGILEDYSQFLRCGSSYIVNLRHIVSVDRGEIRMDNGRSIYLPRNKAAEFKKKYFTFYFRGE